MLSSSLEPLLTCSGINQARIKTCSLKGRQRDKERKKGRKGFAGIVLCIPKKRKHKAELSNFTLLFVIISSVPHIG